MTKAYWIAHVSVDDPEAYAAYRQANAAAFQKYGARFLARGGRVEVVEGETRPRFVVIEFEEPLALVDYLVLVHPTTLEDVPEWYKGEALLAVAARVGTTRLIDNVPVLVGPGGGARETFAETSAG